MNVRVRMDSNQKILLKRYLNKNGRAQAQFSKECAKWMNNYVPFDKGRLKDFNVVVNKNNVTYEAQYAARQFYTNRGKGKQGTANGGLRGKRWDRRMWADKGNTIVKSIADFVGGRSR